MQPRRWTRLAVMGGMVVIGLLGFVNIYRAEAQSLTSTDYILVSQNLDISTQPGAVIPVVVAIKNLGTQPWTGTQLKLGTVFSNGEKDRKSIWQDAGWASSIRVNPTMQGQMTYLNQIATFNFNIKAPAYRGLYKEHFVPMIEGVRWMNGDPIVITINVGDELHIQDTAPEKELRIYRKTQQADWVEKGYVVATLPISTGKLGYETPAGEYTIFNHIADAYSSEYNLWMPNWMGLTSPRYGFRGYGLHALPYWKVNSNKYEEGKIYPGGRLYTQGRLYEGFSHLGLAVSHGCIRFGINEATTLYNWAPNGTKVVVM